MVLDAGPLSLVTHPKGGADAASAKGWLAGLLAAGARVRVPEIADYEVRRELLRAGRTRSVGRLDRLAGELGYLALDTAAVREAARLWAYARNRGRPTAPDAALDADVILAAQARMLVRRGEAEDVVVATTNVGHLSRFVAAEEWSRVGMA